jgi:hypothetical protein
MRNKNILVKTRALTVKEQVTIEKFYLKKYVYLIKEYIEEDMFQTKRNLCHKPVSFFYLLPSYNAKHEKKSCINCEAKYCR